MRAQTLSADAGAESATGGSDASGAGRHSLDSLIGRLRRSRSVCEHARRERFGAI